MTNPGCWNRMKIRKFERELTGINIERAEQIYEAKYVGEFAVQVSGGSWTEQPRAVFYQPNPKDPAHSNYFALHLRDQHVYITDARSVAATPIMGILCPDGEIIYSRYRHDFVQHESGIFIDGGRDYGKRNGGKAVWLAVIEDQLKVITDDEADQMFVQLKLS